MVQIKDILSLPTRLVSHFAQATSPSLAIAGNSYPYSRLGRAAEESLRIQVFEFGGYDVANKPSAFVVDQEMRLFSLVDTPTEIDTISKFEAFFNDQFTKFKTDGAVVSSQIVDTFRKAICVQSMEDWSGFLEFLPKEKLTFLVSSLAIKSNFTEEDLDALLEEYTHASTALSELSKANTLLSISNISKNYWLTAEEKYAIEKNIHSGTALIDQALKIVSTLKSILDELKENDSTNAKQLLELQLLSCCELAKSIGDLRQLEASIRLDIFSKPKIIQLLESVTLNKFLASAPAFTSGMLSASIYVGLLICSSAQISLFVTIASALAIIVRVGATTAVWLYDHREAQKTKDNKQIKVEIFGTLNSFLEERLNMSADISRDIHSAVSRAFSKTKQTFADELATLKEKNKELGAQNIVFEARLQAMEEESQQVKHLLSTVLAAIQNNTEAEESVRALCNNSSQKPQNAIVLA